MKCIIIEDQPPAQRILKKYISDYRSLELIGTFPDAIQALEFLRENETDLIFLDIHLPKLSGIDFLKSLIRPPSVILTTAFSDFALESYDFNVVDYLLKPFSFTRFIRAIQKVEVTDINNISSDMNHESVFIKSGYDYIKVAVYDILYITSDGDYTQLVTSEKKYLSSESLKYWVEYFKDHNFIRTHKSYIIAIDKIKKITSRTVDVGCSEEIPIGRAYREEFSKRLSL